MPSWSARFCLLTESGLRAIQHTSGIDTTVLAAVTLLPWAELGPVHFAAAQRGWVGAGSTILATDDGGRRWTQVR